MINNSFGFVVRPALAFLSLLLWVSTGRVRAYVPRQRSYCHMLSAVKPARFRIYDTATVINVVQCYDSKLLVCTKPFRCLPRCNLPSSAVSTNTSP